MVMVLPIVLLAPRAGQYKEFQRAPLEVAALLAALGGLTAAIFLQRDLPLQFLIFPALTLVAVRLGPAGAAVAGFVVAMVCLPLVMLGDGPSAFSLALDKASRIRLTELVVVAALLTALVTAGAVAEEARLRRLMIGRDRAARAARIRARQAERLAAEVQAARPQKPARHEGAASAV
jgi:integral membrane sensor domain MASE1